MKKKSILFSALVLLILTSACNEKHKNYGLERQDTVNVGDSTNNIQNKVTPPDTVKH